MPKYLKTKEGSLESAVLEAVSPAQQAAIAISKKEKAGKPGYDKEGKSLKDDMTAEDKEAYEKFFKSALKKFGVDSPADFKSDEEKKKFFDYIDKNYKGENEETEIDENIMSTPGKDDYIVLIQGPGDNNQKIIQVFKGKSQLNKAKKARDDWNTKNADKIKKNKNVKPIPAHMARLYMHPASATLDGKPNIPKVGNKVMWSSFGNRIIKSEFEPVQEETIDEKQLRVFRVSSSKLQGNVHAKDEKEAEKIFRSKGAKGKITITDRGPARGQPRLVNDFEPVVEETLAMRTARHISDMGSEASKKDEVKSEEDKDEKKEDGKTMTGKPISKVDTKVVEKD